MSYKIPRIQYSNVDLTGTTAIGSGTVSSLSTIDGLIVGQFIRGAGIPTGATIGAIGTDYVTLASGVLATANGSGIALAAGYEILFAYPPKEENGEILTANATESESLSGVRQTSINFVAGVRKMKFSHLSPTIYALVDTFLRGWAMIGYEFRYYEDQTSNTYVTVSLDVLKVVPLKIAPVGADIYSWEVPLDLRRAL